MVDLMDASPEPGNRRLDHATFEARTEERRALFTEAQWEQRYERLEYVINQVLEASISLVPREVLRRWKGSVGVDATLVTSPARAEKLKTLDQVTACPARDPGPFGRSRRRLVPPRFGSPRRRRR